MLNAAMKAMSILLDECDKYLGNTPRRDESNEEKIGYSMIEAISCLLACGALVVLAASMFLFSLVVAFVAMVLLVGISLFRQIRRFVRFCREVLFPILPDFAMVACLMVFVGRGIYLFVGHSLADMYLERLTMNSWNMQYPVLDTIRYALVTHGGYQVPPVQFLLPLVRSGIEFSLTWGVVFASAFIITFLVSVFMIVTNTWIPFAGYSEAKNRRDEQVCAQQPFYPPQPIFRVDPKPEEYLFGIRLSSLPYMSPEAISVALREHADELDRQAIQGFYDQAK